MFELEVKYPEQFSRGELLLRTLLGWLYIFIPHVLVLVFIGLWASILWVYTSFCILLKGRYPKNAFKFYLGLLRWLARLHLTAYNLKDGYPSFGLTNSTADEVINISYNESPNRFWVLLRFLIGPLLLLPHLMVWVIQNIWCMILTFLGFWMVLFTGKYPKAWFETNVNSLRWIMRVMAFQLYLMDSYPPFSGQK